MRQRIVLMAVAVLSLLSCSKDYGIELPPHESRLVVECYLEDGQPMRALVTESVPLLDTSIIPPVILDAVVTITHLGVVDTLEPFVYVDTLRSRFYTYGSAKLVQADYSSSEPYRIDVYDSKGRHAYGVTRFIKQMPIASLTPTFVNDTAAYCLTRFADDPAAKNYYQMVLTRNARYDSVRQEILINESFVNNSGDVVFGSGRNYRVGDSIHATLYHLTYDYYQYLNTSDAARGALTNPFAVSGEVVSNIKGGLGVFAALSYTQMSVRVSK